ncbi:MAG: hypothetical protein ACJ0O0_04320 [Flavobacteriaceae bacterium]
MPGAGKSTFIEAFGSII